MYKSYLKTTVFLFRIILLISVSLISIFGKVKNVNAEDYSNIITLNQINGELSIRETNIYDDSDTAWVYNGNWSDLKTRKAFGGKIHVSNKPGSDATITFTGSKFILLYTKAPEYGKLEIYVDGEKIETINQKNSKTSHQKEWKSPQLGWGTHTIKFVHKNGDVVNIDAIKIRGGNPEPTDIPVNTEVPNSPEPEYPTATNTISVEVPTLTSVPSATTTTTPTSSASATIISSITPAMPISATPTTTLQSSSPTLTFLPSPTMPPFTPSQSPTFFMSPTTTIPVLTHALPPVANTPTHTPTFISTATATVTYTPFSTATTTTNTPTGNIYYVSLNGNDKNPGTQNLPWRTIQRAASFALSGSVIKVLAGTYPERVIVNNANITFQAEGQVQVIRFSIHANSVTIEGFTSKDNDSNSGAFECIANGCIIKNNRVENSCMAGIILRGNNGLAESNIISKSRQCDGNGADADGIRVFNDGNKIIGNHVSNISLVENPTAHIDCIQSWGTLTNTLIHQNFCDTAHAGVQTDSGYNVQNITITENKFIASRPLNIYVDGPIVTNNVLIGKSVTGFNSSYVSFRDSKNIIFTNNIVLNTTDGILTRVGATTLGGNNVFWNDNGIAPRRDSGYSGNPSSLKWSSDKWQTITPMLDVNYFTGNLLVCYAGLGCVDT